MGSGLSLGVGVEGQEGSVCVVGVRTCIDGVDPSVQVIARDGDATGRLEDGGRELKRRGGRWIPSR